jgi:hypothetical protein
MRLGKARLSGRGLNSPRRSRHILKAVTLALMLSSGWSACAPPGKYCAAQFTTAGWIGELAPPAKCRCGGGNLTSIVPITLMSSLRHTRLSSAEGRLDVNTQPYGSSACTPAASPPGSDAVHLMIWTIPCTFRCSSGSSTPRRIVTCRHCPHPTRALAPPPC